MCDCILITNTVQYRMKGAQSSWDRSHYYVRALDMDLALAAAGDDRQNCTTCSEHLSDTTQTHPHTQILFGLWLAYNRPSGPQAFKMINKVIIHYLSRIHRYTYLHAHARARIYIYYIRRATNMTLCLNPSQKTIPGMEEVLRQEFF